MLNYSLINFNQEGTYLQFVIINYEHVEPEVTISYILFITKAAASLTMQLWLKSEYICMKFKAEKSTKLRQANLQPTNDFCDKLLKSTRWLNSNAKVVSWEMSFL